MLSERIPWNFKCYKLWLSTLSIHVSHMLYMEHKQNEFLHYFPQKKLGDLEVFVKVYILFKLYFLLLFCMQTVREKISKKGGKCKAKK